MAAATLGERVAMGSSIAYRAAGAGSGDRSPTRSRYCDNKLIRPSCSTARAQPLVVTREVDSLVADEPLLARLSSSEICLRRLSSLPASGPGSRYASATLFATSSPI